VVAVLLGSIALGMGSGAAGQLSALNDSYYRPRRAPPPLCPGNSLGPPNFVDLS